MTPAGAAISLAREFAAIVGEEHVAESARELAERGIDGVAPALAVAPGTPEEVAAVMRLACEHQLRVTPIGGATQQGIGNPPPAIDLLLDLRRLDKVEYYDPGDLTISLQAGITVAEVQRRIGEHRQMLPLDPPDAARATVGGTLASASQGPMRHAHGGVRDFCIGIQFVQVRGTADGGREVRDDEAGNGI